MQLLKAWRQKLRGKQYLLHQKMDQWIYKNISGVGAGIKFKLHQRFMYSSRASAIWHLARFFVYGYLVNHLFNFRFNQPQQDRKLLTEYYTLASRLEQDRLEQLGTEVHLMKLYERGRQRGLTQIQLLQLIKMHQVDQPAKPLAQHIQYLRNLKS